MLGIKNKIRGITSKNVFLVCLMAGVVFPVFLGSCYALPSADDFSNANRVHEILLYCNPFVAACKATWDVYWTWQGTFTSAFLIYFLRPFETMGITGLRLCLCINTFFLAISIIWLGNKIAKILFRLINRNIIIVFELILIFVAFEICRGGKEIFYWFTGACVYTIPMGLTCCCLALYMQDLWEGKKHKNTILLCILSFLASGGVLQVTAILCYGMLILWILYLNNNKDRKGILAGIPFLISLLGALINAFAPGNFVRHTNIEDGIHLFKAIKNVLIIAGLQVKEMFIENPFLLYMILFCFLAGLFIAGGQERNSGRCNPAVLLLILVIGLLISIFPFCLGYGKAEMSLRNTYICDLYTGVGGCICAWTFGDYLGTEKKCLIGKGELLLTVTCVMLIFFRTGGYVQLFEETSGKTFYQLRTGDIQRCADEWQAVLTAIESSDENVVVIQIPEILDTILKIPGLDEDESNWINMAVAQYYGKEKIKMKIMREE